MKYSVTGADKKSGDERTVIISAANEKDAERQAREMGLLVATVFERAESSGDTKSKSPLPSESTMTPAWKVVPTPGPKSISHNQGAIIIVLILVAIGAPFFGEFKKPPQWEYTIDSPSDERLGDEMAKMGDDGWELVFARRAVSGTGDFAVSNYEMIFKRPKPQSWRLP